MQPILWGSNYNIILYDTAGIIIVTGINMGEVGVYIGKTVMLHIWPQRWKQHKSKEHNKQRKPKQ